ncbi:ABC-three component system middle component 8 [Streptomyces scabiei]
MLLAVSFLYLLGKVEYSKDNESVFLLGVGND